MLLEFDILWASKKTNIDEKKKKIKVTPWNITGSSGSNWKDR